MTTYQFSDTAIPAELTDCVKGSVESIFQTIFGSQPTCKEDVEESHKFGEGVVGIISYVGDITWMMMLAFPRDAAEALALKFVGFEVTYESPEMGDVVGELANVLAGDLVARLAKDSIKVTMSLPTIMRGHDVEPLLPRGMPSQKLVFNLPEGPIYMKLAGSNTGEHYGRTPGT